MGGKVCRARHVCVDREKLPLTPEQVPGRISSHSRTGGGMLRFGFNADTSRWTAVFTCCCLLGAATANAEDEQAKQNPAEALELPTVEIVGTTPLPGLGTPMQDVPANVQIYTNGDLHRQRQTNITDFLEQNPAGIATNAAQGNPFQPDINFRGFSASP